MMKSESLATKQAEKMSPRSGTNKKETPFPLAYLDWCKKNKSAKTVKDTERRDWVIEFYHSEGWGCKSINGIDFAIAMGTRLA